MIQFFGCLEAVRHGYAAGDVFEYRYGPQRYVAVRGGDVVGVPPTTRYESYTFELGKSVLKDHVFTGRVRSGRPEAALEAGHAKL